MMFPFHLVALFVSSSFDEPMERDRTIANISPRNVVLRKKDKSIGQLCYNGEYIWIYYNRITEYLVLETDISIHSVCVVCYTAYCVTLHHTAG